MLKALACQWWVFACASPVVFGGNGSVGFAYFQDDLIECALCGLKY